MFHQKVGYFNDDRLTIQLFKVFPFLQWKHGKNFIEPALEAYDDLIDYIHAMRAGQLAGQNMFFV